MRYAEMVGQVVLQRMTTLLHTYLCRTHQMAASITTIATPEAYDSFNESFHFGDPVLNDIAMLLDWDPPEYESIVAVLKEESK